MRAAYPNKKHHSVVYEVQPRGEMLAIPPPWVDPLIFPVVAEPPSAAAIVLTVQPAYTLGLLRLTSIEMCARTHFWWCPYRLLTRYFPPTGTHLYAR